MDLFEAIKAGDLARVRALVAEDPARAAARDEQGLSAVLTARYHRQDEALAALLAAQPELDVLDAAATGRLDVLREQIEADPDALAARSPEGFTPLHLAAFFGGGAAVRLLLAAGMDADADQENPARVRPLHSAVAARDHDAARALLEAGADADCVQQGGFTPLLAAAHHDDAEMAELLLRHGADRTLAAAEEGGQVQRREPLGRSRHEGVPVVLDVRAQDVQASGRGGIQHVELGLGGEQRLQRGVLAVVERGQDRGQAIVVARSRARRVLRDQRADPLCLAGLDRLEEVHVETLSPCRRAPGALALTRRC